MRKVVVIGGGKGTVKVIKGLAEYSVRTQAVFSTADSGGSGGMLRRKLGLLPYGDMVTAVSELSTNPEAKSLVSRYKQLDGHKLGNLILAALILLEKDFACGWRKFTEAFPFGNCEIIPITKKALSIVGLSASGYRVNGEDRIDMGDYPGKRGIKKIWLASRGVKSNLLAKKALREADLIVVGPGDLYSTLLPNFLVGDFLATFNRLKTPKVFICNAVNRPEEYPNYRVADYLDAFKKHGVKIEFDHLIFGGKIYSMPEARDKILSRKLPDSKKDVEYKNDRIFGELLYGLLKKS